MAQLKDTIITGNLSVTNLIQTEDLIISSLTASCAILTDENKKAVSREIYNPSNTSNLGWTSRANDNLLVTKNALAYWNGRYNSTASNLAYCSLGAFGDLAIKSAATDVNPSSSWEAGTNAGPSLKITVLGQAQTTGAVIPSASDSNSGIITIDTQTFHGNKTFIGIQAIQAKENTFSENQLQLKSYGGELTGYLRLVHNSDTSSNMTFIGDGMQPYMSFAIYSPKATAAAESTGFAEIYKLPLVDVGLTAPTTYDIVTTKALPSILWKRDVDSSGYPAIVNPDGTSSWIRIGNNADLGLLPPVAGTANGGNGYLGTSSWYWKEAYIDKVVLNDGYKALSAETGVVRNSFTTKSTSTGQYIMVLINETIGWMLNFTLRLYQDYTATDLQISGYWYGTNHWYSPNAVMIAGTSTSSLVVSFGYNSANQFWVAVPAGGYTGAIITDVCNGYEKVDMENLFTISRVTNVPGTTQTTVTVQRPWYRGETVIANQIQIAGGTGSTKYHVIGVANYASTAQDVKVSSPVTVNNVGVFNAVWNDYAEYRISDIQEPGRVIIPSTKGIAYKSTKRLQPGGRVISDTYGFAVGETDTAKTPIGLAGRVLVYPYRNKNEYHIGDAVCSAPNGTVDIMSREEIKEYPDRIIGIVNEIPDYEIWKRTLTEEDGKITKMIEVKGRIWIDIK